MAFAPLWMARVENLYTLAGVASGVIAWIFAVWRYGKPLRNALRQYRALVSVGEPLAQRMEDAEFLLMGIFHDSRKARYICDGEGKCIAANPALAHLFGLEAHEMEGWGWLAGIAHTEHERIIANWERARNKRLPYMDEYTLRDGRRARTSARFRYDEITGELRMAHGSVELVDS